MRMLNLKQGQCCIIRQPAKIITLLGSCLGIIMFDESTKLAGIAHCVLPRQKRSPKDANPFVYVDYCLSFMKDEFIKKGSELSHVGVRLYGGSRMLGNERPDAISVGSQNIQVALGGIKELGLRLIHNDTGGLMGRKLVFHTDTGKVHCSLLMKDPEAG